MKQFEIPVALFLFKRKDTVLRILEVLEKVKPSKIYLISDEGRNDDEKCIVHDVRKNIEKSITWDCDIVKNYAEENRGVYANIGLGAKWVLKKEKWAIFLEDDNLPESTFFEYCREMLERYETVEQILWICGTNYLCQYRNEKNDSYMFTRHQLPCGWASWSSKFLKYYDGELLHASDETYLNRFKASYSSRALYKQQLRSMQSELNRIQNGCRFVSWDSQMNFSVRSQGLLGISPCNNLIRNIGVDENSIHGGSNLEMIMTDRFCENPTFPLEFPLQHPEKIEIDPIYEKRIDKIILLPFSLRAKGVLIDILKFLLGIKKTDSLSGELRKRMGKK